MSLTEEHARYEIQQQQEREKRLRCQQAYDRWLAEYKVNHKNENLKLEAEQAGDIWLNEE